MPAILHCVLDNSGSMSEWHKREIALSLANSIFFAFRDAWPFTGVRKAIFKLWDWREVIQPWSKPATEASGKASVLSLMEWLKTQDDNARILLLGDGCFSMEDGKRLVKIIEEKNARLETIAIGPDCNRRSLAAISYSGICHEIMDIANVLKFLWDETESPDMDMTEIFAQLAEDDDE